MFAESIAPAEPAVALIFECFATSGSMPNLAAARAETPAIRKMAEHLCRQKHLRTARDERHHIFSKRRPDDASGGMHFRMSDGSLSPITFGMPPSRHFWMGGAGLYSTIGDYMKFLSAVANGGRLLGEPLLTQMHESCGSEFDAGWIETADPSMSLDYRPLAGVRRRHGLAGLVNLDDVPGGRPAGSIHWAGATNCYFWVDPTSGVTGAVLAQLLPFGNPGVLEVFRDTERLAYAL